MRRRAEGGVVHVELDLAPEAAGGTP
jgi:hypothetical protein